MRVGERNAGRGSSRSATGERAREVGGAELERAVGESAPQAVAATPVDETYFRVLDEGDELLMLADLPEARPWELRVYAYANRFSVHLRGSGRWYTYILPAPVKPASLGHEFRDGVLVAWATRC